MKTTMVPPCTEVWSTHRNVKEQMAISETAPRLLGSDVATAWNEPGRNHAKKKNKCPIKMFLSTCQSSIPGDPIERKRRHNGQNMVISIPAPKVASVYLQGCGVIDQHNQYRAASLKLDSMVTTDANYRHLQSLLSFCFVNSFMAYRHFEKNTEIDFKTYQNEACMYLCNISANSSNPSLLSKRTASIHDLRSSHMTKRTLSTMNEPPPDSPQRSMSTSPKRNRKHTIKLYGQNKNGLCYICKRRNTVSRGYYYCKECSSLDTEPKKYHWLCGIATGRGCINEHISLSKMQ